MYPEGLLRRVPTLALDPAAVRESERSLAAAVAAAAAAGDETEEEVVPAAEELDSEPTLISAPAADYPAVSPQADVAEGEMSSEERAKHVAGAAAAAVAAAGILAGEA